ncbi:VPLPA-CTERM sorting domain-containing protein [Aliishimia ponticola]|nr:VPLPA-CTERM sorting domain-containing protein [Aliishimia ponticola]
MAVADCDDLSPGGGDTVTCTATDIFDGPDSIETRALDDGSKDVVVIVETDAVIDTSASGDDAIKLQDDGAFISNSGSIIGGDEAIVGGEGLVVANQGLIAAPDHAIVGENEDGDPASDLEIYNGGRLNGTATIVAGGDAIKGGDGLYLENYGVIAAGDDLIQGESATGPANDVSVLNFGEMTAVDKGITVGDGLVLDNAFGAVIQSLENEAVEAGDNAVIYNAGGIFGFDDAIQVGEGAFIENYGTIENTQTAADIAADLTLEAQDAIDIDSGYIYNEGTILSVTNAAIDYDPGASESVIENFGIISGTIGVNTDDADTASQFVSNAGLIEGTEGTALFLGQGDDALLNVTGSEIAGGADFGAGADLMVFDASFFDMTTGLFADGSLFAGGEGEDTLIFEGVASIETLLTDLGGDVFKLSIFGALGQTDLTLTSWENIVFADALAPVPLPAGAVLFGTALAGLGLAGRRRRAAK